MTTDKNFTKRSFLFFLNYVHYGAIIVLLTILLSGYFILSSAINAVIDRTVINNAETVSTALSAFRSLYTREVVDAVRNQGIEISHQHQGKPGVIPLPATISIELGDLIASGSSGASASLYSPYPFPWREEESGKLNDSFRTEAWEAISQDPSKPFIRVETHNGISSVRYATADVMQKSCVNCHNTHPDSPKVDWKVGDVRGLLEVTQPVATIKQSLLKQVKSTYLGFSALLVIASLGMMGMFIAYRKRVEDNESLVEQLEKNNHSLLVVNEELQQFAYRTSHDLKAPLLSIKGLSQYINDDLEDGELEEAKKNVVKISQLSTKLEDTIDNILDLTKAEYLNNESELIEFDELIDGISDNLDIIAKDKNVAITKNFGHGWDLYSQKTRIRQVLENLISNGIKYADREQQEPYVSVTTKTVGEDFLLCVKDNGIGIPDDKKNDVFSMFSRFHPKESAGSGLGLYLVKKHVDALNGNISFKTNSGTEFIVRLPKKSIGVK